MSEYNEKSKEYTMKYIKNNYDEFKLRMPKGAKDAIKNHIAAMGDKLPPDARSMQGFIKIAIAEKMYNDKKY